MLAFGVQRWSQIKAFFKILFLNSIFEKGARFLFDRGQGSARPTAEFLVILGGAKKPLLVLWGFLIFHLNHKLSDPMLCVDKI